jgi:hypothetical protein
MEEHNLTVEHINNFLTKYKGYLMLAHDSLADALHVLNIASYAVGNDKEIPTKVLVNLRVNYSDISRMITTITRIQGDLPAILAVINSTIHEPTKGLDNKIDTNPDRKGTLVWHQLVLPLNQLTKEQ